MGATLERELKLTAETDAELDELARLPGLGPALLGSAKRATEVDTYLDTADGRLAAARWACRLRERQGRRWISLKGPAEHAATDAVHRRPEVEGPAGTDPLHPAGWPESPARDLVRRLAGAAPLAEQLVLRQERTERALLVDGQPLATLSLDRAGVEAGGVARGRLRVVELELAGTADEARVRPVIAALLARPALRLDPASKLERALAMLGRAPTRR